MQAKKPDASAEIRYLKGVGPRKSGFLNKLGITKIADLLYYLPRRYEDRAKFASVKELKEGEHQTVVGEVRALGIHSTKRGKNVFQLALADRTGIIYCVWFNQPFLKKFFRKGQRLAVYGKVERYDKLQINHPEYEVLNGEGTPVDLVGRRGRRPTRSTGVGAFNSLNIGRIAPVYSLTEEVSQRFMRYLVNEAIKNYLNSLKDSLPTVIRARRHLADLRFAVHNIHFPGTFENLEKAYRRLVFEEFFILQLALAVKKKDIKSRVPGISHRVDTDLIDSFRNLFPFELTGSQLKAVSDIERDMASSKPMNRLLEGDVGSGKTAVAVYAVLLSVNNGYQAALMAPTEILARQHFINLSELLMPLGVNVRLLVSGLPPAKKSEIQKEIERGEAQIVIGTHALLYGRANFRNLGLVVVDEQHKFGVRQRHVLRKKGRSPDVLVMTATPIPRTLALTLYGDLDISVIKELPKGRRPITTYSFEEKERPRVYEFVREEIAKGRQAYIVYPRIWSNEKKDSQEGSLKAAAAMYAKLQDEVFPDLRLGLVHGRMNAGEKERIMKKVKNKKIDILIATTVIEVGIDVPNASLMVIENAERFGLSQLHQLRGRIGRGEYDSYCILLGKAGTEEAEKRFNTMTATQDGFKVAEEDLELRGPGEFFGTKQHGLPELRFGNILRDFEVMEEARAEAFDLVKKDPGLRDPRNAFVRNELRRRFAGKLELVRVG